MEEDVDNANFLKEVLINLGYFQVYIATSTTESLNVVNKQHIDFAFIDINIESSLDGIACAKLINEKYFLPIIYTTANADSTTMNSAIKTNMYGYLIKPFYSQEVEVLCNLVQKIAICKNNDISNPEHIIHICNNNKFDLSSKTLTVNNRVIKLSKNELKLLDVLCKNINHCVPYDIIKEHVWENKTIADSTMRDTISRLRRKANDIEIESFSGIGYCLKQL